MKVSPDCYKSHTSHQSDTPLLVTAMGKCKWVIMVTRLIKQSWLDRISQFGCNSKLSYLNIMEASKHQSLKHILNIKCWLCMWDKALDRGCIGTIAIQKLIQYLATPVFNDRCQYCTRSINPTVTCAKHLIICKSLPIPSLEPICKAIENFEDSVFGLSKVISNLLYLFHSV